MSSSSVFDVLINSFQFSLESLFHKNTRVYTVHKCFRNIEIVITCEIKNESFSSVNIRRRVKHVLEMDIERNWVHWINGVKKKNIKTKSLQRFMLIKWLLKNVLHISEKYYHSYISQIFNFITPFRVIMVNWTITYYLHKFFWYKLWLIILKIYLVRKWPQ